MTAKEQWKKITDNWLIILIVLVILLIFSMPNLLSNVSNSAQYSNSMSGRYSANDGVSSSLSKNMYYPSPSVSDFAPEIADRKITKTVNLGLEITRGEFNNKESEVTALASSTKSIILSQNVNSEGSGKNKYSSGSYTIKIPVSSYDLTVTELKKLGEVKSFSENSADITASFKNTKIEIAVEKERLARYQAMYDKADIIADKITLNDRIFDEERTIKYLEDSLNNLDNKVEYSTVYLVMTEKTPNYIDVAFVKFADLVKTLVQSMNSLLYLIFAILPYAIFIAIIWGIIALVKHFKAN